MSEKPWISELIEWLGVECVFAQESELVRVSYDEWPVAIKWRSLGLQPYRPDVIVRPLTIEQVSRLLSWASERNIPVTPRGAGSGVTGAAITLNGGICLDLSEMDQLLGLDEVNLLVRAQAGMLGGDLEDYLNQRGYTLHHSPQSLYRSTVGGWVATRASGQFSSRWGSIEDLLQTFTVVLSTGEVVEMVSAPRAAMGPDLRHLFIGSEGILGVIVDVTLKIFPLPEYRRLEAVQFPDLGSGLYALREIMRLGLRPFLVRFYDPDESKNVLKDASFSGCLLFLGHEGIQALVEAEYEACANICQEAGGQLRGSEPVSAWMRNRFDFSAIETALKQPGGYAETLEISHFWDRILGTYDELRNQLIPLADRVFGHFSHVYPQGSSLYIIIIGQAGSDREAEERLNDIWHYAMRVCLEKGAALSHHHGIGLARLPFIREGLGSNLLLLERVKSAIDPAGIMNPLKFGIQ